MNKAQADLFDLDGTLLETAPALVGALNVVLQAHGKPKMPLSEVRPFVSRGARGILQCGLGLSADSEDYLPYVEEFLGHYREGLCRDSRLFEGMPGILDKLDAGKVRWGVVTNKMAALTEPLLRQLDLFDRMHVLVSGDTLPEKKPSPRPLLYACGRADMRPEATLYVGDDPRDIEAARAAGMVPVAARYGYYDTDEDPDRWGADHVIDHPSELESLIAL